MQASRQVLAIAIAMVLTLAACGNGDKVPSLMNIRSTTAGPDEFGIIPPKALEMPEDLAVLPRAAVHTRHYLRVPVHQAQQIKAVGAWLAAQQVPVLRVELACEKAAPNGMGPQVLVLTDAVAQSTVDLAVHALAAHPAVAGPVAALRVEMLEG